MTVPPTLRRLAAPLLALLAAGCLSSPPITIDSDPPGALVLLDGEPTGFATPCSLEISGSHEIRLELPGYEPAGRRIRSDGQREMIFWREATVGKRTWRFPLWLNIDDFFDPVPLKHPTAPDRLFVRLRREADR